MQSKHVGKLYIPIMKKLLTVIVQQGYNKYNLVNNIIQSQYII